MVQLSGIDQEHVREQKLRSSNCVNEAIWAGCRASITSLAVSGASVAALQRYSDVSVGTAEGVRATSLGTS